MGEAADTFPLKILRRGLSKQCDILNWMKWRRKPCRSSEGKNGPSKEPKDPEVSAFLLSFKQQGKIIFHPEIKETEGKGDSVVKVLCKMSGYAQTKPVSSHFPLHIIQYPHSHSHTAGTLINKCLLLNKKKRVFITKRPRLQRLR